MLAGGRQAHARHAVSRPDLTSWLSKAIAEQRRIDLNVAQAETVLIEKAHPTVAAGDSSADGDIRILLRTDEERKTKRNAKVCRLLVASSVVPAFPLTLSISPGLLVDVYGER